MKWLWRKISSPAVLLWLLISILIVAVVFSTFSWKLEVDKIASISVAAAAFPLAFLSQHAILRGNQRQTMRYEAYKEILKHIEQLESILASVTTSELTPRSDMTMHSQKIRLALRDFTNTYHSHEMVFRPKHLRFKYLHYYFMKLYALLDGVEAESSYNGYGDKSYAPAGKSKHTKSKNLAGDLAMYLYDLKKELIESLGFDRVMGTTIEIREPADKKYKLLKDVATKKAVTKLMKESKDA